MRPGRAARRIVSGLAGHEGGADFENALDRSHKAYLDRGLAWIDQLPVPTVPARGDVAKLVATRLGEHVVGTLRTRSRRQGYDFFGYFGPEAGPDNDPGAWHGLALAMEAKRNSEVATSLPIAAERKDAKGHTTFSAGLRVPQMQALAAAYRDFGVVAVVVWHNGPGGGVLLPDALLRAHDAYFSGGRKSLPASDFQPYEVIDYPGHPGVHDWLFVVRCWLEKHGRPGISLSKRRTFAMVKYHIDYHAQTVVAAREDGSEITSRTKAVTERRLLEQLARDCKDADEFIAKINSLEAANEA